MNQTIKTLLKIQDIDKSIHEIKEDIKTIETDVKTKEDAIKAVAKEIEEIGSKIDALIKDKEHNEQLVEDKNSQIEALNNKSSLVKNQKEQRALEIEMSMADNAVEKIEDQIVSLLSDIDSFTEQKNAKEKEMEQMQTEYEQFKKTASEKIKNLTASVDEFMNQRMLLFGAIDDATARQYEEINRWAEGNAMSEIKSESCMGCFLMLPPQVSATIMETDQLVFCPNCGRILYINDET